MAYRRAEKAKTLIKLLTEKEECDPLLLFILGDECIPANPAEGRSKMKKEKVAFKAFQEDIQAIMPFFELTTDHQRLPWFIDIFNDMLSAEAEFSFGHDKQFLEITQQGQGHAFHAKIEKLMRLCDISEEDIRKYQSINQYFPHTGTLLKCDFHRSAESGISLYYQSQIALRHAARIVRTMNGLALPAEVYLEIGKLLGRKGVYGGMDFRKNSIPAFSLFYPLSPQKARVKDSFLHIMEMLQMSENQKNLLDKYHDELSAFLSGDLFVSFPVSGAGSPGGMKIDYELVNLPLAIKVLKETDISEEELRRFLKITRALDTTMLSYFGIKYRENGAISHKFYFKRVYFSSESQEMDKIATFLESSIWRLGD